MTLSVIVITRNEAAHIGDCLDSVAFADEIIVLDSGSTDATREIARARGARVEVAPDWPGFGPQKNRALALATGDWVLSIDADERVTPELAGAIRQAIGAPAAEAYRIARLSNFCGRWIRHSGWWPDYVVRLFRREAGRFTDAAVHERVEVRGRTGTLSGHFLHYPYATLEVFIDKINRYSTEAARAAFERGRRTTALGPFGHGLWTFVRHYVLRRGFLDGWQGLVLAGMAATGSFYRYVKLYWLGRGSRRS
ncbi:glycosyltransferase family 2 protein [Castellaniella defragrans]|uniref:Glycosyltransferase involved in cell wall biosynthesis n=2 Tax=Castellaniella defragrans TaxID=75697 RepID=A0A7W9TQL7_CASDE|nr:glycosyltransferase family 2 protein [Castellaniella defragrans]KAB0622197.1 glycosyltransferase family 2 protein [Castellaniella defragrans]MBB6085073.1 glycosyltransferase involved in cell wall biosynthesis [Castellaniella defragrans]CDM24916.1 putative transferase [Castellaniella defragrans 65Phen]